MSYACSLRARAPASALGRWENPTVNWIAGPVRWTARARTGVAGPVRLPFLPLLLALLGAPALAGDNVGPYVHVVRQGVRRALPDTCRGESIRYRFRASAPIDFNIHYHRGDEMTFPVKRAAVREIDSTFTAKRAEAIA